MIAVELLWNFSPLMNSYGNDVCLPNLHDASFGRPALLAKADKSADCFRFLRQWKNSMLSVEFLWNSSPLLNPYGNDVSLQNLHDARFGRPATNDILFPRSFGVLRDAQRGECKMFRAVTPNVPICVVVW